MLSSFPSALEILSLTAPPPDRLQTGSGHRPPTTGQPAGPPLPCTAFDEPAQHRLAHKTGHINY
jgi:hypothetical protein